MNEIETRPGFGGMSLLLAFMGGALAGALTMFFLAPRSGAETLKQISDVAERSRRNMERVAFATREAGHAAKVAFTSAFEDQPQGS